MNKEEYKKIKSLLKKIHKMYIKKRQEEERWINKILKDIEEQLKEEGLL